MPGGPKLGVAAAVLRDYLYVVGGFSDTRAVGYQIASDVERYDISTDRQEHHTNNLSHCVFRYSMTSVFFALSARATDCRPPALPFKSVERDIL